MFYEIKSIENPGLEKRIIEIAHKSGISVDKIYVIEESRYSKHTNAFFVGFGDNKRIYLYDTLIQNNSEAEIISILTHEIGHWAYNHNLKGALLGFLLSLGVFVIGYYCLRKLLEETEFAGVEMHSPSLIPVYLLLFIIFSTLTNPLEMAVSRKMEREADYYALRITEDPDAFISSEIKIARDNSSRLNRHPVPAFFRSSHPMTIDRIKMAERFRESTGGVR
jgi:STE24 endopeptidase